MDPADRHKGDATFDARAFLRVNETVVRNLQQWIDHPSWDYGEDPDLCEEDIEICLQLFRPHNETSEPDTAGTNVELSRPASVSEADDGEEHIHVSDPVKRFVFERVLGTGAFGIVLCVFDRTLGRKVALKVLRPSLSHLKTLRRRFLREVQVSASLDHPRIVRLFETGHVGNYPYIMSPMIDGPNLADYLQSQARPLPINDAVNLIATVGEALQYAHERGVLHRDLKPSNILLDCVSESRQDGKELNPHLTDFGLAKQINAPHINQGNLSDGLQMLGTLKYCAPEQALGQLKDVGVASDVFSLGAILYQLLSGCPPRNGETQEEVLNQILHNSVTRVRSIRSEIPVDLDNIVMKSLSRDKKDRYASAGALVEDLRRFLQGEPVMARRASMWRRARFWAKTNPAFAIAVSVFSIVVGMSLTVIIALFFGQRAALHQAERNREVALEAVADAYENVAETFLQSVPNTTVVRRDLALKSLEKHQELVDEFRGDAVSRFRLSIAYHYAAKAEGALDHVEARDEYFEQCMKILKQLIAEDPSNVNYRFSLFFNKRLLVLNRGGDQYELAVAELRPLIEEIKELCRLAPDNMDYRDVAAATTMSLADMLEPRTPSEALPFYLEAAAVSDDLLRRRPDKEIYSKYALVGRARAAEIYMAQGQLQPVEELCQRMLATLESIPAEVRGEIWFEEIEREPQDAYGRLLVMQNRWADAILQLRDCELRYQRLLEYFPESSGFEIDHLRILALLHQSLISDEQQAEAASVKAKFLQAADSPAARTFGPPGKELVQELLRNM